ncbi:hypothetical protein CENSYa_0767 [Cenarchaeum symbiosum A]|uniref:SWIM-type domain-containing protein n=1 Tax=Cenarchaeum symbiosum (strain A) TaxID=414004 RepID=A0RVN3_CENSY|nr:hypothetical protein CENSYa_0767 [Cenarchaeum symbiosum A]
MGPSSPAPLEIYRAGGLNPCGPDRGGGLVKQGKEARVRAELKGVWTVVGRKSEYWADPGAGFCSCPAYYFGRSSGRKGCYHLDTIRSAVETGRVERIDFADEEYRGFLSGIFAEMWRSIK